MELENKDEITIPRSKEEINISKRTDSNTIKIKKSSAETKHIENVKLRNEEVEIEEIIIDQEVFEYPEIKETDDLIIIPVVKEIEVVVKKKILIKEIHIKKIVTNTIKNVEYTIREEHVHIEGMKK